MEINSPGLLHLNIEMAGGLTDIQRKQYNVAFGEHTLTNEVINSHPFWQNGDTGPYVRMTYSGLDRYQSYLPFLAARLLPQFLEWLLTVVNHEPGQILGYFWPNEKPQPIMLRVVDATVTTMPATPDPVLVPAPGNIIAEAHNGEPTNATIEAIREAATDFAENDTPRYVPNYNPPIPDLSNGWQMLVPGCWVARQNLNDAQWLRLVEYFYHSPYGDSSIDLEDYIRYSILGIENNANRLVNMWYSTADAGQLIVDEYQASGEQMLQVLDYLEHARNSERHTPAPGDWLRTCDLELSAQIAIGILFEEAGCPYIGGRYNSRGIQFGPCNPGWDCLYWDSRNQQCWSRDNAHTPQMLNEYTAEMILGLNSPLLRPGRLPEVEAF